MTRMRSAVAGLGAVLALAACTSPAPSVRLDQTIGTGGSLPPLTPPGQVATVTESVTTTMTVTVTVTSGGGPTALPTAPSIPATFDATASRRAVQAVLVDVRHLDRDFAGAAAPAPSSGPSGTPTPTGRTSTSPGSGSTAQNLRSLGSHLGDLLAAGVPTGTDGPSYVARILSLQTFVSAAAEETRTNPVRAAARYGVIRTETAVLLTQVGAGTGDTLTLPPSSPAR